MKQNGKAKGDINGFLKIHLFMWLSRVSAAVRGIFSPHRAWGLVLAVARGIFSCGTGDLAP